MVVSDRKPSLDELQAALDSFVGEIDQVPPIYSAIKINGQRAYKLARAGKEVTIEPRKVTIYGITDVMYRYPEVTFTTKVSSGTYIRSLVQDIGTKLTTGAYLASLSRAAIGEFELKDSVNIFNIDRLVKKL
jgi:tRNA pseudouridine55 synthase